MAARGFVAQAERGKFLAHLVHAISDILRNRRGLSDQANFHCFCRLLVRLKANYQLSELVAVEGYKEWIELVALFTTQSFRTSPTACRRRHIAALCRRALLACAVGAFAGLCRRGLCWSLLCHGSPSMSPTQSYTY